jgi:hypothetical protein
MTSAMVIATSGLSVWIASRYSSAVSWLNPTDVQIAMAELVLWVGHGTAGTRRGPRILRMSSFAAMYLRSGESLSDAGVFKIGAWAICFSMTRTEL